MAKGSSPAGWQRALVLLTGTVVGVVVVTCLYWAQAVFIPVALAIFLTFLLSPPVSGLQRVGLGRVPSVILVVCLTAVLLGGLAWLVTRQLTNLVAELPTYDDNIRQKVASLRELSQGGPGEKLTKLVRDVQKELDPEGSQREEAVEKAVEAAVKDLNDADEARTVIVQPERPAWLAGLRNLLTPFLELLGTLALAIVLAVFMLLKREDLRNRLIRLAGQGRITVTTKAVDDAGKRISRFLLMQLIVNGTYGLALSLGLFFLGVHYAFLWGFLAAVLRYIPYIGPWLAAILPITLSLAQFEGWQQPLLVIGLFLVLELLSNNIMEPMLYGQSIGVSEVALLVAAAFWTFLWGPIGLVLSAPLTVCLVVLGKYVPQLSFFDVLLGDAPPLSADITYYQRLLAGDLDEATDIVETYLKTAPQEKVYDALLVPALTYVRRDRAQGELTEIDERAVLQGTKEVVADLSDLPFAGSITPGETPANRVRVLCCPARDEADRLALEMLQHLLDPSKWEVEVLASGSLSAELAAGAEQKKPAVVVIGSLPPGGLAQARYLCKRLRARLPQTKLLVGRWGLKENLGQNVELLRNDGADEVDATLLSTRDQLTAWLPILSQERATATSAA